MLNSIAYLDCHSGIDGGMFLGSMLDAGLDLTDLERTLSMLPLRIYHLSCEHFTDKGVSGSRFDIQIPTTDQSILYFPDVQKILHSSALEKRVRNCALAIFTKLVEAEATVRGISVEEVPFHEMEATNTIVDIVGAAWGVETLGIEQIYASALPLSSGGHVQTRRGLLPVPAPATLEILRRVSAPWKPSEAEGEMITPAGAAILATLARFEIPAIAIERVGYGFGHKSVSWPDCLRICLGRSLTGTQVNEEVPEFDWVNVLACNIDTMTGEHLGNLMELLLASGALDVSYTPLQMKKNRPAVMLTLICQIEDTEQLATLILAESSTLGVRIQQMQRRKAQRSQETIATPLGPVQIKVKRLGQRVISAAPEYEDCRRVAHAQHIPLEEVYEIVRSVIADSIKS